jgi:peptidoglycan hydrolase-like protein with peptidoglycan-binding domain
MGRRTREAIRNFQQDNNIKPTGFVDAKTMQKLNSLSAK